MGRIMSELFPFNHAGNFTIGKPGAGSRQLKLFLTVPQGSSKVTGHGVLFQATNPPLHIESTFHGTVHALNGKQVYALQGVGVPPIPGAPHVADVLITLDQVWGKEGKASYRYVVGSHFEEAVDQPVSVQWLLQNGERAA